MPLRLAIIIPFTLLFAVAAAVISGILLHNSQVSADTAAKQLSRQYTDSMAEYVSGLIVPLHNIVEVNRDALLNGSLDLNKPATLAAPLLRQMRVFKHMTFISVANADGRYIASARDPDSEQLPNLAINFIDEPLAVASYQPTEQDKIGVRSSELIPYDPRQRPFYVTAVAAYPDFSWGNISRYVGFPTFGLGVSAAIADEQGNIIGVSAAGMALQRISDFLASLADEELGYTFVAEKNGTLIATSSPSLALTSAADNSQRLSLKDHPSSLLRHIGEVMQQQHMPAWVNVEGKVYLVNLRPLDLGFGETWWLGVLLPEDAFTSSLTQSTYRAVTLIVLTLLLMAIFGFFLAHHIASPISEIAMLAQSRSLDGLQNLPYKNTAIREVKYLSNTVSGLASELQHSITELENRVRQRTSALKKANRKLKQQSHQDGLTGIANRRTFDETISREWKRAMRHQHPLSVIMADIDHFKSFNDHYGHQKGDDALRAVATTLDQQPHRPGDTVARYGGEEFTVILPQTDAKGAADMAEKLRQAIVDLNLEREDIDKPDRITLSLGVATLTPDKHSKPDDLVLLADKQLYEAKNSGRNRVC